MVVKNTNQLEEATNSTYDRDAEVKAFEDSKVGVKGLVESGVLKIPRMFHTGKLEISENSASESKLSIPIVDFKDIHNNPTRRVEVIDQIQSACHEWGFFQVINHEIPITVLDEMIDGIRKFHEQDADVRKVFYTRDFNKKFTYYSNVLLFSGQAANWRDTINFDIAPHPFKPDEVPAICRDIVIEYSQKIKNLGFTIFELMSEALGFNPSYLKEFGCAEGLSTQGHLYPPCPEPELTMGATKHTDTTFMTLLLQDQLGGLQVLHEDKWVDVPPVHGALVVNIGDLLQLITNDKFVSVFHRVLPQNVGSRISIASFFVNYRTSKVYGPIKELITEEDPPIYKDVTIKDFTAHLYAEGHNGKSSLESFKL